MQLSVLEVKLPIQCNPSLDLVCVAGEGAGGSLAFKVSSSGYLVSDYWLYMCALIVTRGWFVNTKIFL